MAFEAKDPTEVVVATFDFTRDLQVGNLNESIFSINGMSVTVTSGTDPNPTSLLVGAPVIGANQGAPVNTIVKQGIQGGIAGNQYDIKCTITTSGNRVLVLAGILPIVAA